MQDGNEFGSIVSLLPDPNVDLMDELVAGLAEIEKLRGRPCLAYVGNVVRADGLAGVDSSDDVPFAEMVSKVPSGVTEVDVVLATNGGSAHQVSRFVNALRARFDRVAFLLPSFTMSAGTLFALSGDEIWMTSRACLGPIDPQVPSKDGRFVPAQALLLLVAELQRQGDEALKNGQGVPWTAIRIIDSIDKKELGDAISASNYSTKMAAQFLQNYKFRSWTRHKSNQAPVTAAEREEAALEIAQALASHDRWKAHGHAISREVLWDQVKLLVDHPDPNLEKAMVRLWALCNWLFDKTNAVKFMVSGQYRFVRNRTLPAEVS
jgi:hypothetical protein